MAEDKTKTNKEFEAIISKIDASEKGAIVKKKGGKASEAVYIHEEIMSQENVDQKDLPPETYNMIIAFKRRRVMADLNESQGRINPDTMNELHNLSALIADRVMDYLEKDIVLEAPVKKEDGGSAEVVSTTPIVTGGNEGTPLPEKKEGSTSGGYFDGLLGGIFNW